MFRVNEEPELLTLTNEGPLSFKKKKINKMQNTLRYKCGIICLQMDTLDTHIQKMFQGVTSRSKRLQSLLKSMNRHNIPIPLGVKGHFEKHLANALR